MVRNVGACLKSGLVLLLLIFLLPIQVYAGNDGLLKAIWDGDVNRVSELIQSGADVNQGAFNDTPVMNAISHKRPEILKILAENGANLEPRDSRGRTPLHHTKDPEIARVLLDGGADINASDNYGNTALIFSPQNPNGPKKELFDLFLERGADVNARGAFGQTALSNAVLNTNLENMNKLLDRGADINAVFDNGETNLMRLIRNGGFEIGSKDVRSLPAFLKDSFESQSKREMDAARLLLERGIAVNAEDYYGNTALSLARKKKNEQLVALLEKYGAREVVPEYKTLLQAAKYGNVEKVRSFLEQGKSGNDQDENAGLTPLCWTMLRGHLEVAELLLEHGVDTNIRTMGGKTALMIATERVANSDLSTKAMKLLLSHGADPNVQDDEGGTALMTAAVYGSKPAVKLLLKNGADPNLQTHDDGLTAAAYATMNMHNGIVKMLRKAGAQH